MLQVQLCSLPPHLSHPSVSPHLLLNSWAFKVSLIFTYHAYNSYVLDTPGIHLYAGFVPVQILGLREEQRGKLCILIYLINTYFNNCRFHHQLSSQSHQPATSSPMPLDCKSKLPRHSIVQNNSTPSQHPALLYPGYLNGELDVDEGWKGNWLEINVRFLILYTLNLTNLENMSLRL